MKYAKEQLQDIIDHLKDTKYETRYLEDLLAEMHRDSFECRKNVVNATMVELNTAVDALIEAAKLGGR